ncbi:MAG: hypothetical protein J6N77_04530 [Lachnospiraceae bacterium]|nr:hypothetical protein [Lachnospiraceae bacterium]
MKNEKKNNSGLRKFLLSPVTTIGAFVLAAGLLLFSGIGGARSALTYFSETYASRVQMFDIGVTLEENFAKKGKDAAVSYRNYNSAADGSWNEATGVLLGTMLADAGDANLVIGKKYPEELTIMNSGTINHFARVSIYKYWSDADGNKIEPTRLSAEDELGTTELTPALIDLNLVNVGGAWLLDKEASTDERTVLYYSKLLEAGKRSEPFTDTLKIDEVVGRTMNQTIEKSGDYTKITNTYTYDKYRFTIEVTVDAVQEHNAQDAIKSAWGRDVTISGTSLSLN